MNQFLRSLMLVSTIVAVAGCDMSNSLGGNQDSASQEDELTATKPFEPLPVSARELTAINRLRERKADIDLDNAGHARIVELVESKVVNDDLSLLSDLPCLESLDITGGEITGSGLVHLEKLKNLQRLYLQEIPIKSDTLSHLSELKELDVLSLRNTEIDDTAMVHLKKLAQLTVINLSKTAVTDQALKQVRVFTELDTLVLADTAVTGEGLVYLQPLKKLRTLNVDRCNAINGHLMKLDGMPELRIVYVFGCDIPPDEVDELTAQSQPGRIRRQLTRFSDRPPGGTRTDCSRQAESRPGRSCMCYTVRREPYKCGGSHTNDPIDVPTSTRHACVEYLSESGYSGRQ